jgi:hypothetical protein
MGKPKLPADQIARGVLRAQASESIAESRRTTEWLPPFDRQLFLLESMAALARRCGGEPLRESVLVEPSREFFPDPYVPTLAGVRQVARRLLAYAGLEDFDASVEAFDSERIVTQVGSDGMPTGERHEGAAAWFAGFDGHECLFGVDRAGLEDEEQVVGVMAHEVAHAWRSVHRVVERQRHLEEVLTDLTSIYLGFGVFTVNRSYRYRASSDVSPLGHRWSHESAGYLSPQEASFGLAIVATCRRWGWWTRRRVGRMLEPNQRTFFHKARRALHRPPLAEEQERLLGPLMR